MATKKSESTIVAPKEKHLEVRSPVRREDLREEIEHTLGMGYRVVGVYNGGHHGVTVKFSKDREVTLDELVDLIVDAGGLAVSGSKD